MSSVAKEKHLLLVCLSEAASFKPPSLPPAQLCVSTEWPLRTRSPPNHHHLLLRGLKTQIKNQCHNRLEGSKPCKLSAADALFS